jgi:hypothetical protein
MPSDPKAVETLTVEGIVDHIFWCEENHYGSRQEYISVLRAFEWQKLREGFVIGARWNGFIYDPTMPQAAEDAARKRWPDDPPEEPEIVRTYKVLSRQQALEAIASWLAANVNLIGCAQTTLRDEAGKLLMALKGEGEK